MIDPDHYRTLGVHRFAAPHQVRRAYVSLLKDHDNRSAPLTNERLRAIGLAYGELRHPGRRVVYDSLLRADDQARNARGRRARRRVMSGPAFLMGYAPARANLFAAGLFVAVSGCIGCFVYADAHSIGQVKTPRAVPSANSTHLERAEPQRAALDEAFADVQGMAARGAWPELVRRVRQCFGEMRTAANAATFDYCVTLDALAAANAGDADPDGYFGMEARRARLADVALGPADMVSARWNAVNKLVARRSPMIFSRSTPQRR